MVDLNALAAGSPGSQSQSDILVDSYKKTQQYKINTHKAKQANLERTQGFYNSLYTRVNSLVSELDRFDVKDVNDKFVTRTASLSDKTYFSVKTTGKAQLGVNSVNVKRLASNDIFVTKQLTLADKFADGNKYKGEKKLNLEVDGKSIEVKVNFTGEETKEEAMKKVVEAVNNTEDIGVTASLIKDTGTTGRLTFTSKESGEKNQVKISGDDFLKEFGITPNSHGNGKNRKLSEGIEAGYMKADAGSLNSELTINGIKITRDSNTVSDVLSGFTFELLKPHKEDEKAVTVTTEIGTKEVEEVVQPLLDKINSLFTYLDRDKKLLRTEGSMSTLRSRLRSLFSDKITSAKDGNPSYLSEIGIKANSQGQLEIADKEQLEKMLKEDPQKVADLFTSNDGIVAKVKNSISNLSGKDGLITRKKLTLSTQITREIKRKKETTARIDQRAHVMRKQYEAMLKVMLDAQNQFQSVQ